MEFVLLVIIALQFGYIVYKDILSLKEREQLQLKLMSNSVDDYVRATGPVEEVEKIEPDMRMPIEEASAEQIAKAILK